MPCSSVLVPRRMNEYEDAAIGRSLRKMADEYFAAFGKKKR